MVELGAPGDDQEDLELEGNDGVTSILLEKEV
jgi:hypothetical protein